MLTDTKYDKVLLVLPKNKVDYYQCYVLDNDNFIPIY